MILRHETGHVLDSAYRLRERADWREVFGSPHERYPDDYAPRRRAAATCCTSAPGTHSRIPTEDFAETFAVWLQPRARWRREYAGWPALRKLDYVDALMAEIARSKPRYASRREIDPVDDSRRTLGEHYRRKAARYMLEDARYDRMLRRLFTAAADRRHAAAAQFLRSVEARIGRRLVREARLHPYVVEHTMQMLLARCSSMQLHLRHDRRRAQRDFGGLVERVAQGILKRNRESYAL